MDNIPECFYRISVKALILNESRDKFLVCEQEDGWWDLPGGGLDWGMTPQEDLPREIEEEMGLALTYIADFPSYFLTCQTRRKKFWVANVMYEAKLEHLDFTPSGECVGIKFIDKNDLEGMTATPIIEQLAEVFDPARHVRD